MRNGATALLVWCNDVIHLHLTLGNVTNSGGSGEMTKACACDTELSTIAMVDRSRWVILRRTIKRPSILNSVLAGKSAATMARPSNNAEN